MTPPEVPAACREAARFELETPPKNCVCREMAEQESSGPCDACCDAIARAVLLAADTAETSGPWAVAEREDSRTGRAYFKVERGESYPESFAYCVSEPEARTVANALNRTAARAAEKGDV